MTRTPKTLRGRPSRRALGFTLAIVAGATGVALLAWLSFGRDVHTKTCCGTTCWEVDEHGEAIDPTTQVDCVPVTIETLP
ncbi:MAG: hypothetical protein AAGF12_09730 [Myxococcota bacterium]